MEQFKKAFFALKPGKEYDFAQSYLWYQTEEQAREFLELRNSLGYRSSLLDPEIQLLLEHASFIDKLFPRPYAVVDLGCGDGAQAKQLIPKLPQAIQYIPVDTNEYFLKRASRGFRIPTASSKQDFAQLYISTHPALALLLGNTVGNFHDYNIIEKIGNALHSGDVLVIGSALPDEYLIGPSTPPPWKTRPIEYLGIPLDKVQFSMRKKNNQHEDVFELLEEETISYNNEQRTLRKGDIIIAMRYSCFTAEELHILLEPFFDVLRQTEYNHVLLTIGMRK